MLAVKELLGHRDAKNYFNVEGREIGSQRITYLNNPEGCPAFVHAWTASSLAEGEIQVADKILFSLELVAITGSRPGL